MSDKLTWFLRPPVDGPRAALLLRVMAGTVFLWEGVMKFVFANQGIGRFTKIGFPMPGAVATFVALLEIVGGLCLIAGAATRVFAALFIAEMLVAIASTKVPMLLGTSPLALPPAPPKTGIWAVLHEVRSEWAQLMVCAFLLWVGPGPQSVDAKLLSASRSGQGQHVASAGRERGREGARA